ncbi:TPA: hypothetical protein PBN41_002465 [Staphylococcus aureus]|nr:hypothetical protein [Staphylococcus aureus]HDD8120255.1 hypothetical protein [Staphylococcus aureus]
MDLIENGKDANEVLKMPFHYVLSIYQNKNNDISEEKAEALIDAFNLNRLVRVIFLNFFRKGVKNGRKNKRFIYRFGFGFSKFK